MAAAAVSAVGEDGASNAEASGRLAVAGGLQHTRHAPALIGWVIVTVECSVYAISIYLEGTLVAVWVHILYY